MTQTEVRELMSYNKETGICTRLKGKRYIGRSIGSNNGNGYLRCKVRDKSYYIHRLIFLYMEGYYPEQVDHIDGDRSNNKWDNLRAVTNLINCRNKAVTYRNKSGANGVYFHERLNKWTSEIRHDGKSIRLGWWKPTEQGFEDAKEARRKAEIEYGYHSNHGRH